MRLQQKPISLGSKDPKFVAAVLQGLGDDAAEVITPEVMPHIRIAPFADARTVANSLSTPLALIRNLPDYQGLEPLDLAEKINVLVREPHGELALSLSEPLVPQLS